MKRIIRVLMGEAAQPVGTIYHIVDRTREHAAFEYDAAWLARSDRFTIDPTLLLVRGPQYHKRPADGSIFHAAIADSEPDGWARQVIRRDHAKRRSALRDAGGELPPLTSDLDFLLEIPDITRIGALRFQDESGVFCRTIAFGQRAAPPLIELSALLEATRAVETNTETAQDLAYLRGRGTSLGGMRPKCSIMDDDGTLSVGKFPSVKDERAVTKGEVLALQLAARAGIDAAQSRLVESGDAWVAVIKRFDRDAALRIPYTSAATLLGARVDDGITYTYEHLASAIRAHGADAKADLEELWRRIAFSILITNIDDHLHNHGFLHVERGTWRLSPAFDINPFPERARELKTWISEDAGPAASIENLLGASTIFGLSKKSALEILRTVEDALATWRDHARTLGMTDTEIDAFEEAFEHEERVAAARAIGRAVMTVNPYRRSPIPPSPAGTARDLIDEDRAET